MSALVFLQAINHDPKPNAMRFCYRKPQDWDCVMPIQMSVPEQLRVTEPNSRSVQDLEARTRDTDTAAVRRIEV